MYARQLFVGLLSDHDGGEVGRVGGQTEEAEDGPQVHQQAARPALGRFNGHRPPEQDGVAHVESRRERKDAVAVASAWRHAKRTVPLVQGEENGSDME